MNIQRAAQRYAQIAELEQAVEKCEASIEDVQKQIDAAAEQLGELRKTKAALMKDMRAAARDEGELPLIDLMEMLATIGRL